MTRLILIRGIPGSGKSTLAKQIETNTSCCIHLETDMYFYVNGVYEFDVKKLRFNHQRCLDNTNSYLNNYFSVVVSNTFTTKRELRPYFEIAKKYNIVPEVILCQNQFGSIHDVPDETIEKMKKRFQYDISDLFEELS